MYTIFRNSLTQYSRRLLSILAQPPNHQNKKSNKGFVILTSLQIFWDDLINVITSLQNKLNNKSAAKKKCGAHTHVHHLSQLFFINIHVSCCLFSHNKIKTCIKAEHSGVETARYKLVDDATMRHLIICTKVQNKKNHNT